MASAVESFVAFRTISVALNAAIFGGSSTSADEEADAFMRRLR
jgi:hypothetical protein